MSRRGKIITGPGDDGPEQPDEQMPTPYIPAKNLYFVTWFNPITNAIEEDVRVEAHVCDVSDSGQLIFRSFLANTEDNMRKGEPPVLGYYVRSFCGHITFRQEPPIHGKVQ